MTETPAWYGPDGILGTEDDLYDPLIQNHIVLQDGVPDDMVAVLNEDGTVSVRPLGGRVDQKDGDDS